MFAGDRAGNALKGFMFKLTDLLKNVCPTRLAVN